MCRELPRTLYTLRAPYQKSLTNDEIDIVVVDNGSKDDVMINEEWSNVRSYHMQNPTHSPVKAINFGLTQAKADFIGVMIDGARMASPNMLHYALLASKVSERTVVSTMAYHLGSEVQMKSVPKGYNQKVEDELLETVPWHADGYSLFDISVFAGSSAPGWFKSIAETNALFMGKNLWNELGGYDERFSTPGGGLVNLDTYLRATELCDSVAIRLLGEGTFHQVHGGVATNQQRADATYKIFHEEYKKIRNKPFAAPERDEILFGRVRQSHKQHAHYSLDKL